MEVNIYSAVTCSYLQSLPDDNADIFGEYLVILYCSFLSLILSSIVMTTFYILSERLCLKCKGLSDVRVALITRKEYGLAVHFL